MSRLGSAGNDIAFGITAKNSDHVNTVFGNPDAPLEKILQREAERKRHAGPSVRLGPAVLAGEQLLCPSAP